MRAMRNDGLIFHNGGVACGYEIGSYAIEVGAPNGLA
jgi:hypothetical protein